MDRLRLLETPAALRLASDRWRAAGLSVGLVPTMGALHRGHRSLLQRARRECDRVVASIFVNPTQFGPGEDFDRYPRSLESDLSVLREEGADAAFVPSVAAMYPPGFATRVGVGGPLTAGGEAVARPGHFDGVALVVTKLLVASRADRAYFGAKDAQQAAVVSRLAADLDTGTAIVVCPTVRDDDGLALSSRNMYLSPEERRQAQVIPAGLAAAARLFAAGERRVARLVAAARGELAGGPDLRCEYVEIVDRDFRPVSQAVSGSILVVAARIGSARLIDALRLGVDAPPLPSGATSVHDTSAPAAVGGAPRSGPCTAS